MATRRSGAMAMAFTHTAVGVPRLVWLNVYAYRVCNGVCIAWKRPRNDLELLSWRFQAGGHGWLLADET